jgi:hypothetical protein
MTYEMSHRGPNADDVLDWDEARDPMRAPDKALTAPWRILGTGDRQLLDALSDGLWTEERPLRKFLRWGRVRFFVTTVRLVIAGWIEARPANSFLTSEYRLSPEVWK